MTKLALLSVFDKTGITELARSLVDAGWTLLSSGGTAAKIAEAGLPVTDVADHTGSPIMLGHRVVTLHPKVHGGILADRNNAEHQADLETHDIAPIDLVVVNLYPFNAQPGIEMIDIGGPTMVRAAAKNHEFVGVVVDPADYPAVASEIADGDLSADTKRRLARKAFAHTAAYDASIVSWLDDTDEASDADDPLPDSIHLAADRVQDLRYGENPHQVGARFRFAGQQSWWDDAVQHNGKALSYLNLLDTESAWQLVHALGPPSSALLTMRSIDGGLLVQTTDRLIAQPSDWTVATDRPPTAEEMAWSSPVSDTSRIRSQDAALRADFAS